MDTAAGQAAQFVAKLNEFIIFPTIALLSGLALLLFIYGCFVYITSAADPSARQTGVRHITWSIVGLVVMLSAYAILALFAASLGLTDDLDNAKEGNVVIPPGSFNSGADNADGFNSNSDSGNLFNNSNAR